MRSSSVQALHCLLTEKLFNVIALNTAIYPVLHIAIASCGFLLSFYPLLICILL